MKKRLLAVLLLVLLALPVLASDNRTASTEHFDIIYREESLAAAACVYENCESIYTSLVSFFGKDPKLRIPVVITSAYKDLNAYYSAYPSNRIVLYDTVASKGDLTNYKQTILSIFRHELSHAFQFNFRGPVFNALHYVFGDVVSLSPLLYLYPSMAEGGAVLSESADGHGRINNSYSMQIVKQAKIEGRFPNWFEVAGARDTYPSGQLYYNFSACFLEYLSQTYGRENIAGIFKDFSRLRLLSTAGKVIKEHIGKSVQEAWDDFYEWVEIPEEVATSEELKSGAYSAVTIHDASIYTYSSSYQSVLKFNSDFSKEEIILKLPTDQPDLSFSNDGSLMLVSYVSDTEAEVRVYNIAGDKAELVYKFKDYRGGAFAMVDGEELVLLYSNRGQTTYLSKFSLREERIIEGSEICLGFDVTASDFTPLADNKVAFIANHSTRTLITILDLKDMSLTALDTPQDIRIMFLGEGLCFTWYPTDAGKTNLGRYGELLIDGDEYSIRLSTTDVNGSINSPVRMNNAIIFSARNYSEQSLRRIDISELDFEEPVTVQKTEFFNSDTPDAENLKQASKDYKAIKFFFDGVLLPYGSVTIGDASSVLAGLTWITTDPTGTYTHQISVGYSEGILGASYSFKSTKLFTHSISINYAGTVQNDQLLIGTKLEGQYSFNLRHQNEKITVTDRFDFVAGLQSGKIYGSAWRNKLNVNYKYTIKRGPGVYEKFIFIAEAGLTNLYPRLTVEFQFPRLLWWKCEKADTTNLPFALALGAQYNGSMNLAGTAKVVLYSREIQHSPSFFGLYFQRFTLSAAYSAEYNPNTAPGIQKYTHQVNISAIFSYSPIIGSYLTKVKSGLGVSALYSFQSRSWEFKLSMNLSI